MNVIFSIIKLIVLIIEGTIKLLFQLIVIFIKFLSGNDFSYKATFGLSGTFLSNGYEGYCLTGKKSLSVKNSYENVLICGSTGTGKSSTVLIPSCLKMHDHSLIVHDPAGEIYTKTAGYLQKVHKFKIKVLDFSNPQRSSSFNPLARIHSQTDSQKVAELLVHHSMGNSGGDKFWSLEATSLISLLIEILREQDSKYCNLRNVLHLLQLMADPEAVDRLFSKTRNTALYNSYKSFVAYDSKIQSGIIAQSKAALNIFNMDSVAQVTSSDTLDFESFRKDKTILYIQNGLADQRIFSVISAIFFEQFWNFTMRSLPNDKDLSLFLLIDELASLGKMPTLQLALSNVRKFRCGILCSVQHFAQLVELYKNDAHAIKANCVTKMYFSGQSLETARELQSILGQFEYKDEKGHKVKRELLTHQEVRMMDKRSALIISGNRKPIKAKLTPYYAQSKLKRYSQIPEPIITNASQKEVLLLPLSVPEKQPENHEAEEV